MVRIIMVLSKKKRNQKDLYHNSTFVNCPPPICILYKDKHILRTYFFDMWKLTSGLRERVKNRNGNLGKRGTIKSAERSMSNSILCT